MNSTSEFTLTAEPERFFHFERVMLSSADCRFFIPMQFLEENGRLYVRYDCSGFSSLRRYRIERTEDVLYVLEKTVLILQHCAEYLIDPRRIALSTRCVYYNHQNGEIRIAYIPLLKPAGDIAHTVSPFLSELSQDLEDSGLPLLEAFRREITDRNLNAKAIIRQIGDLRSRLDPETTGVS